jgi:hypothetical protein
MVLKSTSWNVNSVLVAAHSSLVTSALPLQCGARRMEQQRKARGGVGMPRCVQQSRTGAGTLLGQHAAQSST